MLLLDRRGPDVDGIIDGSEAAAVSYPWLGTYHLCPGPNSNSFVAYVARQVPALGLDLPPTAVGKDYLGPTTLFARAPIGSGWQVSLSRLVGVTVARRKA